MCLLSVWATVTMYMNFDEKHPQDVLENQTRLQNRAYTTRKSLIFRVLCALFEQIPSGINRDIKKILPDAELKIVTNFLHKSFSHVDYFIYIFLTSGVKLNIHLLNVVVQFIGFLTLSTLICRSTDISKCFSEPLGIRDNESRLYKFHKNLGLRFAYNKCQSWF